MITGGKPRLLGISKHSNRDLRKNLIQDACAVLPYLVECKTPLGRWVGGLVAWAPKNVVVVARANKLVRFAWVLLARAGVYAPVTKRRPHRREIAPGAYSAARLARSA